MRIPLLIASAAVLALAACGNGYRTSDPESAQSSADYSKVDDKSLEEQVTAALADAPKNGLTQDLFLKGELPADKAQRRQALLKAAKDYASALANGKTDPDKLYEIYTIAHPDGKIDPALSQALQENRYHEWVNSLAPQSAEYRALSDAFVRLVQRSPDLPDQDIPTGDVIDKGESDPRIPLIARNLVALDYLPAQAAKQPANQFTPAMSQALARFQADYGLKSDGVVGPNTIDALNQGPRDRARTLAVAMERLRWLERQPPATRIDVNTAASYLEYFRDGSRADRRKVIVGQPGWETPQLGTEMYALVANPNWVVPESIAKEEIAGKSSAWLSRNNFTKKDGHWVQQPGPESALGVVKFALSDDQAIYLHDTPAKSLFQQEGRHDSHGCIRVQDALQFAHAIAGQQGIDSKFSQAMATNEETQVQLPTKIPVRLMYHTAYLGEDGRIHYAEDVYGWDNEVASALGYARKERTASERRASDVGP